MELLSAPAVSFHNAHSKAATAAKSQSILAIANFEICIVRYLFLRRRRCPTRRFRSGVSAPSASEKRLYPRLRPSQDEGVDVVGALVGVHRLEVHDVAAHVELVADPVAAMHVAGLAGDVERSEEHTSNSRHSCAA